MKKKNSNPHIGSDFEDFLREEGMLEEATCLAAKQILTLQLQRAMRTSKVSQAELARRMRTSRAVIHRLLDAKDASVTLATMNRAAVALGKTIRVQFED